MSRSNLLTTVYCCATLRTLDHAFNPSQVEAMDARLADAPLKPLSPQEPGWGEGTPAHGAPTP